MAERGDKVWQDSQTAKSYLRGRREAIPCAQEQIDVMLRLIAASETPIERFLDLGCGDGTLSAAILERHPEARGVLIDFSKAMLDAALQKLADYSTLRYVNFDYAQPEWIDAVAGDAPFDAIVSGYSIHHQPDERKRELYREIFDLLVPGGVFVNVEHVSPSSKLGESLFESRFIDSIHALEREQGDARSREQIALEFLNSEDRKANILSPVEDQCQWLCEIGYDDVDCFLRVYELAVFAGRKPL